MYSVVKGTQRGAVLVTAILLLLVLTIIGVTVMQMSRMQERMAGNSRDVNLAFQGAEGALREAENLIDAANVRPVSCLEGCTFLIEDSVAGNPAKQDLTWWEDNSTDFNGGVVIDNLAEQPTATIEELGFFRTDGGVVMGQDPPDGRDFYQVTSRSTGGSGTAEVVLQTTFTRRY
jgi:type IV pilus assembly protein PilX